MRAVLIAVFVLLMLANPVMASIADNETLEDYETRYKETAPLVYSVCGDNLCEGREVETCSQDCKVPDSEISSQTEEEGATSESMIGFRTILILIIAVVGGVIALVLLLSKKQEPSLQ
jgi:preprotein translocase subunit SecG